MNLKDLIEYYDEELLSLDVEIKHHKGRNELKLVEYCKGERIRVRQFIKHLKNLKC